jgi:ligand-binding SRPBCC domain-containing protein
MIYQFKSEQQINCEIGTVWEFFSSPYNLSVITPEYMDFKVLNDLANVPVYNGMIIDYTVSPVWGIPLRWKTRIQEVNYQKSFTDIQVSGPYKLWEHRHEFIHNPMGVLMTDTITYELPLGVMGQFAHRIMVKKRLDEIFAYRFKVVESIFNTTNDKS